MSSVGTVDLVALNRKCPEDNGVNYLLRWTRDAFRDRRVASQLASSKLRVITLESVLSRKIHYLGKTNVLLTIRSVTSQRCPEKHWQCIGSNRINYTYQLGKSPSLKNCPIWMEHRCDAGLKLPPNRWNFQHATSCARNRSVVRVIVNHNDKRVHCNYLPLIKAAGDKNFKAYRGYKWELKKLSDKPPLAHIEEILAKNAKE